MPHEAASLVRREPQARMTPSQARWRAVVYYVAFVCSGVGAEGYERFINSLLEAHFAWHDLAVFYDFLDDQGLNYGEYYPLVLMSAAGMLLLAVANDLIVLFLGLEILSIALYVMAGYNARRSESGEAAIKYFVLGAFSSAIFLYGLALTYGATGSTNLGQVTKFLAQNVTVSNGLLLAGMALLLVGLGF